MVIPMGFHVDVKTSCDTTTTSPIVPVGHHLITAYIMAFFLVITYVRVRTLSTGKI
jgi:hypothetical protein